MKKNTKQNKRFQTVKAEASLFVFFFILALLCVPLTVLAAETTYTTGYTYDANSNISSRTTPDGATVGYTYDAINRLTNITYPGGQTVTYGYDPNSNRTSLTDSHGTTNYSYDRFNKLRAVQFPGIIPLYYDYDKSGNLTKITYPSGETVAYAYDMSNRLTSVTDITGTTTYEYNNQTNNLIKKTLPNGVYTTYTYDLAKRITDVVNKKSDNSLISSYHYTFDANSNITQVVETTTGAKTTNYTYDNLNRLTNATCSDGTFETYTFDNAGNRMTKTTQAGTITYKYDGDNRLIKASSNGLNTLYFYDKPGNLIKKMSATETVTYAYDYENRLILYSDGTDNVSFEYDGDGNRISKTVNGTKTKYINHVSPITQVLLETTDQNSVTARYTYADSRLNQTNYGATSFYVYDKPGRSVTALIDSSQTTLYSYAYDSFGNLKNTLPETTINDFKYVGEQFDDKTGLIFLRHRYYDPETGRFISKDPFPGYVRAPQTINPYPYVGNNPVIWIDPLGLERGDWWDPRTYISISVSTTGTDGKGSTTSIGGGGIIQETKSLPQIGGSIDLQLGFIAPVSERVREGGFGLSHLGMGYFESEPDVNGNIQYGGLSLHVGFSIGIPYISYTDYLPVDFGISGMVDKESYYVKPNSTFNWKENKNKQLELGVCHGSN